MSPGMAERAEILTRFMRGEIDASTVVRQYKVLPPREGDEYVAWDEEEFSVEYLKVKMAELRAAAEADASGPAA